MGELPSEPSGGHELVLEFYLAAGDLSSFVLSQQGAPMVEVERISLSMPGSFALCEDLKVCLNVLANDLSLRNNNTRQWECLHDLHPVGICAEWRNCLMASEDGENHTAN